MGASVKIMLSYDYCHFEVCKSTTANISDKQINEMRKDVQSLADEAIRQYKKAKAALDEIENNQQEREHLGYIVSRIKNIPESEWTPEQKATVKKYEDSEYWSKPRFNYYDDPDETEFDEEPDFYEDPDFYIDKNNPDL